MLVRRTLLTVFAVIALASGLSPSAAAASTKEVSTFHSGAWEGGVYVDANTGAFRFCMGSAPDRHDVVMSVALDRSYGWGLVFSANRWRLTPNMDIPLKFRIDSGPWFDTKAVVLTANAVYVPVAQETTLIELFRHGHMLQLYDGGDLYFDLTGTRQLMLDLGACVAAELARQAPPAKPSSGATETAAEIKPSERQLTSGSGMFISGAGQILTNNHVIDSCGKVRVRRNGDVEKPAAVVARDTTNDLALLVSDLHVETSETAAFRSGIPVRAGESIAVYGFPLPGALSSNGNVVSGDVTALAGLGDDVRYFQISAPIQPGNSGGPLLDYGGLVVGMVNAKLNDFTIAKATGELPQNVNFAIKENVITSFLEAHSIAYRSQAPATKLELTAVADRAQQFTVLVICVP
jgi:S1-C subfamily serine protease